MLRMKLPVLKKIGVKKGGGVRGGGGEFETVKSIPHLIITKRIS